MRSAQLQTCPALMMRDALMAPTAQIDIGIRHDDCRSLATQFEIEFGYVLRCRCHDRGACAHASRKADHADIGVPGQGGAGGSAVAEDQVEHAGREIRLSNQAREKRSVSGRLLARLYDNRIAGDEGWGQLSGR